VRNATLKTASQSLLRQSRQYLSGDNPRSSEPSAHAIATSLVMKGSPGSSPGVGFNEPPAGTGFSLSLEATLGVCVKSLRQVDEVKETVGHRGESAVSGFLCYGLCSRFFTRCFGADCERGPGGSQPSHHPHPRSGRRDSRDNEYPLHFGFGHSNRVFRNSGSPSRPVRGTERATEGWLGIFNLDRGVSRVRVDMPNPSYSASARRGDLCASSRLSARALLSNWPA
jgi:hypothetical protein